MGERDGMAKARAAHELEPLARRGAATAAVCEGDGETDGTVDRSGRRRGGGTVEGEWGEGGRRTRVVERGGATSKVHCGSLKV